MGTQLTTTEQAREFTEVPEGVAVVRHSTPDFALASPAEVQAMMAQADNDHLTRLLMGEVISEWFYSFKVSGKEIEGLSVNGAMEFARLRAESGYPIRFPLHNIAIEELTQNGKRGIRATVIARCQRSGAEGIGMAFYPFYMETRNGQVLDDKNDRKALSVAKRNAILDLIPEAQIRMLLKGKKQLIEANEARLGESVKTNGRALKAERGAPIARVAAPPVKALATSGAEPYAEAPIPPAQHSADASARAEDYQDDSALIDGELPLGAERAVPRGRNALREG